MTNDPKDIKSGEAGFTKGDLRGRLERHLARENEKLKGLSKAEKQKILFPKIRTEQVKSPLTRILKTNAEAYSEAVSAGLVQNPTEFWTQVKASGLSPQQWIQTQQLSKGSLSPASARSLGIQVSGQAQSQELKMLGFDIETRLLSDAANPFSDAAKRHHEVISTQWTKMWDDSPAQWSVVDRRKYFVNSDLRKLEEQKNIKALVTESQDADLLVGWNTKQFDDKVLNFRSRGTGWKNQSPKVVDMMEEAIKVFQSTPGLSPHRSFSLEDFSQDVFSALSPADQKKYIEILGHGKDKLNVSGDKIWTLLQTKKGFKELRKYSLRDVDLLKALEETTGIVSSQRGGNRALNIDLLARMPTWDLAEEAAKHWKPDIDRGARVMISGVGTQGSSDLAKLRQAGFFDPKVKDPLIWVGYSDERYKELAKTGYTGPKITGVQVTHKGESRRFNFGGELDDYEEYLDNLKQEYSRRFKTEQSRALESIHHHAGQQRNASRARHAFDSAGNLITQKAAIYDEIPALKDYVSQSIKNTQRNLERGPLSRIAPYAIGGVIAADLLTSQDKTSGVWGALAATAGWVLSRRMPSRESRLVTSAIGYGVGKVAGSIFTKVRDNSFDGFQEDGFATAQRQAHSDFGSGWRGLFSKNSHPWKLSSLVHNPKIQGFGEAGEASINRKQVTRFGSGWKGMKKALSGLGQKLKNYFGGSKSSSVPQEALDLVEDWQQRLLHQSFDKPAFKYERYTHYGKGWYSKESKQTAIKDVFNYQKAFPNVKLRDTESDFRQIYDFDLLTYTKSVPSINQEDFIGPYQLRKKTNSILEVSLSDYQKEIAAYATEKNQPIPLVHRKAQKVTFGKISKDVQHLRAEQKVETFHLSKETPKTLIQQSEVRQIDPFAKTLQKTLSEQISRTINIQDDLSSLFRHQGSGNLDDFLYIPFKLHNRIKKKPNLSKRPPVDWEVDILVLNKRKESRQISKRSDTDYANKFIDQAVGEYLNTRRIKKINRLSKTHDQSNPAHARFKSHNPIHLESFTKKGITGLLRKKNTEGDFGTGFDAMRRFAKTFFADAVKAGKVQKGKEFEALVAHKGFQKALEKGKRGKLLGEGGLGEIYSMDTTFEGHQFSYARKEYFDLDKGAETRRLEASVLSELSESITPSVYGFSEKGSRQFMFMEKIEDAETLGGYYRRTGEGLTFEQIEELETGITKLHSVNKAHGDIKGGNILVNKKGQFALIDPMSNRFHGMGIHNEKEFTEGYDLAAIESMRIPLKEDSLSERVVSGGEFSFSNAFHNFFTAYQKENLQEATEHLAILQAGFSQAGRLSAAQDTGFIPIENLVESLNLAKTKEFIFGTVKRPLTIEPSSSLLDPNKTGYAKPVKPSSIVDPDKTGNIRPPVKPSSVVDSYKTQNDAGLSSRIEALHNRSQRLRHSNQNSPSNRHRQMSQQRMRMMGIDWNT